MFNQFGSTAETLSKASAAVLRIGTDAHLYDDPEDVNIAPLLDSKFESEKCEALKRLLALIAQGFDVSNFFPQVVKNVASQSSEVKKLVYLYLLHYAEKRPNEALLSINYFQKDLGDPNPLVRAWALRTMAGIRLHVIAPLALAAVGKCARDPAVYVRKCAANALPKLHDLRLEEHAPAIEELVGVLLNDHSPGVVGAAAAAFTSICPNNFELIRKNYKKLCQILPDVEEWGQILLIGTLLRYVVARHGLVRESLMLSLHGLDTNGSCEKDGLVRDFTLDKEDGCKSDSFDANLVSLVSKSYIEGPDEYLSRSSCLEMSTAFDSKEITSSADNEDVKILLQCTSPLLWSNNSAVVLAAAGVQWIMAPLEDVKRIVKPLLFLLRSSSASKYVVLCNILVFAKAAPSLFASHFEDFFICSSDVYQVKAHKLEMLSLIATTSSISSILREFEDYIKDPDRAFAADTVAAIGLCVKRLPTIPTACLDGLLALVRQESFAGEVDSMEGEAGVLMQAVMSIETIVERDPLSHEKVIIQLFRSLDSIKVAAARATIIWMVGVYCSLGHIIPKMLTTITKYLAWSFKSEASETKLQILNTTAKVLTSAEIDDFQVLKKIMAYVFELGECDLGYDVRDRTRFLKKLLSYKLACHEAAEDNMASENKYAEDVVEHVFGRKLKPFSSLSLHNRFYLPGSLSQIVLHAAPGYEPLPKPCSFVFEEHDQLPDSDIQREATADLIGTQETSETADEDGFSEYDSESYDGSDYSSDGNERTISNGANDADDPLIQISEVDISADQEELRSKRALDLWLDDQPSTSNQTSSASDRNQSSYANLAIGDIGRRVKPKSYTLLEPGNGNGLKVDYTFLSEVSTVSPLHVCVELLFANNSTEPILEVNLEDEESTKVSDSAEQTLVGKAISSYNNVPTLIPMEEISSLEQNQSVKRQIQVRFHHHLLAMKLTLHYNEKKVPVKLRPDLGYLVKPFSMSTEEFLATESRLPGMFEYSRRCTLADHVKDSSMENGKDKFLSICECITLKMLSNSNLHLVSVDLPVSNTLEDATGLRLRFSSKILSSEIPLLITITVQGKCTEALNLNLKINCEETVFGLNLLNRIANFMVESSSSTI